MTKKRRRHTPEQIIRKLDEGHRQLASGKELDEVYRHLEIAESTWHRWLAQYGGMKANGAKRLKELEGENARLKKLLAEAELDKSMLSRSSSLQPSPIRAWRSRAGVPARRSRPALDRTTSVRRVQRSSPSPAGDPSHDP